MLNRIHKLLEMIRFSHTLFALPFALLSAALAWKYKNDFSIIELVGIISCMVCARTAAMAFNRIVDRKLDAANPRTSGRHLPAGQLSVGHVWVFTIISSGGFVAATLIFLARHNPWPTVLSLPVLAFIGGYSFAKRFTVLSHFWLGASLMLAPVASWIAICGMRDLAASCVLGFAVLFWVAGFDILYACQDVNFDRTVGLFSIPARLGIRSSLWVALVCHLIMIGLLICLWAISPYLSWIYLAGVGCVGGLLAFEHWLVRPDDLARVNQAFFHVNGVISIGLFLVVLLQLAFVP